MRNQLPQREIIATYSVSKVAGWVIGVGAICAWLLLDAAGRHWAPPTGVHGGLYPMGIIGAVFGLVTSVVLTLSFVRTRGVAILRTGDELVLNFPFSRRRIPIGDVTATAIVRQIRPAETLNGFTLPAVIADQVSFDRVGAPSIPFRTGLLSESAATIVQRIQASAVRA